MDVRNCASCYHQGIRWFLASVCLVSALIGKAQQAPAGWSAYRANAQSTGQSTGAYTLPTQLWSKEIGANINPPAVGPDGTVYLGNGATLYAIDGATGAAKWSYATSETGVSLPTPGIGSDGTVYVTSNDGHLYALNGSSGALLWSYAVPISGATFLSTPNIAADGTVYFSAGIIDTSNTMLFAVEGGTGKLKWSMQAPNDGWIQGTPTIDAAGTVYVSGLEVISGAGQCFFFAVNPSDGTIKWASSGPTQFGANVPVSSSAVGPNGTLYVVAANTGVAQLDSATGKKLWAFPTDNEGFDNGIPLTNFMAIGANGTIYVASAVDSQNGALFALNGSTGAINWSVPYVGGTTSPALGADGTIYVGAEGNINAYTDNGSSATLLWSSAVGDALDPVIGPDGALYTGKVNEGSINVSLVKLNSIHVVSVNLNPSSVVGGTPSAGTIGISAPAPTGGLVVWLTSDSLSAIVPVSVTVPAGQTTAAFSVTTRPVDSALTAVISASPGINQEATLTIVPPSISVVSLDPSSVVGGNPASGVVSLNGPAGPSGLLVTLSSSNQIAAVPATVTIPSGASSATFTANTAGVSTPTPVQISGTLNAQTQAASLTVIPATLLSLTLNPTTVVGGNPSIGTVTLNGQAGPGGTLVSLASNNSTVTLPSTVTVPADTSSASFSITTKGVNSQITPTVTAKLGITTEIATLTVVPAGVASVSVSPSTVVGGNPSTGTVTLNGQAGPAGTLVSLSSNSSNAVVSASVVVPAGLVSVTFSISTIGVASQTPATITAAVAGISQQATLTITPASLKSLGLSPSTVLGGSSTTGTVILNGLAGPGGASVTVSSGNTAATVPSSVAVPAGQAQATFTITTTGVNSQTAVSITATLNGPPQTATLTIKPPTITSVSLNPSTIPGGSTSTGVVTLSGPAAPTGTTVLLSSPSSVVTVPTSVTLASGQSSASFTIGTQGVNATTSATVTATLNGQPQSATLTITPASLTSIILSPTTVTGGNTSSGTVTISGPAGSGGVIVSLSGTGSAVMPPTSVVVPSGQTSASFIVNTNGVGAQTTATITASLGSISRQASLTVLPATLASLSLSPSVVAGGNASTGTVTLSGRAGPGGTVVSLSSNVGMATIPASVMIVSGQSTGQFTIQTSAVAIAKTATITATLGTAVQNATLTINPPTLDSVSLAPTTVAGTTPSAGTVILNGPAPAGGISIRLSSSTGLASVPASVTIGAGASRATFTVSVSAVSSETTATISASLGALSQSATLTMLPIAISAVTLDPSSVTGGASSSGTVLLNGQSPKGGTLIRLASSNKSASIPASVIVPAGQSSVVFTITTTSVGSEQVSVIKATVGISSASATLTVVPAALATLSFDPSIVVGGKSSTGTVKLSGAAPAGGLVVMLTSSADVAVVPTSVTVAAGKDSATFTAKTLVVGSQVNALVTASLGGGQTTANLAVTPPGLLALELSPTTVSGGNSSIGTVTISEAAPVGGVVIVLSVVGNSATLPASMIIPVGKTSATFTIKTTAVTSKTTATISATLGSTTKSAVLTVT